MFVELTFIVNEEPYSIKGDANITNITVDNQVKLVDNPVINYTKIQFKTRSPRTMAEWQKPLEPEMECTLKVSKEEYKGVYKCASRLDGSPIIFLFKQIEFEENK